MHGVACSVAHSSMRKRQGSTCEQMHAMEIGGWIVGAASVWAGSYAFS